MYVTVDPESQKSDQQKSLHKFLTQNAGVRIIALDKNQSPKFVFNASILNVENDDQENVIGYDIKREISYALTKKLPKPKIPADQSDHHKQFPLYEGEEVQSSEDEPFLTDQAVVIRRKRKNTAWPGLERGIPRAFNAMEDSDKALWDKYHLPAK